MPPLRDFQEVFKDKPPCWFALTYLFIFFFVIIVADYKKEIPSVFCPPLSKYSMSIQFSCRALTHAHESKNVLVSLPFLNQEKDAKIH